MDFDEIKGPTRDFNVRSTKLSPADVQAIHNARNDRDRGKEAENTNYEKNKESLIQAKAVELAGKQKPEPTPRPPGVRGKLKSPAEFVPEATALVLQDHQQKLAQFDATAKQTEENIYERQYAQRMRDKLDAQSKASTKAMDAGADQQEQSKFVGSPTSTQQDVDARSKEPTKESAQVAADPNQQQDNSLNHAASIREKFNNAAQKKGVDQSRFIRRP